MKVVAVQSTTAYQIILGVDEAATFMKWFEDDTWNHAGNKCLTSSMPQFLRDLATEIYKVRHG